MAEYDSFENLRSALRCLDNYFTDKYDTSINVLVDKKIGEAAITDNPASVIQQWIEDYDFDMDCVNHFEVYQYRKVERYKNWVGEFKRWKMSCIKGYIRRSSNIDASFELTVNVS
ncbi:hypothetical protein [Bacillus paranthracis]|uniref:hypothetical protein n=1 Tax=Bacillus paranthracis TaxID=2026186 RepID=UPI0022E4E5F3|nr:hypothetical protein [Bacillus paranthracis]